MLLVYKKLLSEIIDMVHLCCLFLFTELPPLIDILLLQHVLWNYLPDNIRYIGGRVQFRAELTQWRGSRD